MSSALIRPVVAFINTNYTQIPLNFDFKLNLQNFDGAWYPQDANLWVALSDGVGRSIAHRVEVIYFYFYFLFSFFFFLFSFFFFLFSFFFFFFFFSFLFLLFFFCFAVCFASFVRCFIYSFFLSSFQ